MVTWRTTQAQGGHSKVGKGNGKWEMGNGKWGNEMITLGMVSLVPRLPRSRLGYDDTLGE